MLTVPPAKTGPLADVSVTMVSLEMDEHVLVCIVRVVYN